ncbi:MAG TPA: hypothetical protein VME68_07900 [Acidobacteriaceae bacterium]|nr:hypothetical protein [Acidobacteriaceae bacterium]
MRSVTRIGRLLVLAAFCAPAALCGAQVFIVQPEHVEQHYAQITPTSVQFSNDAMTTIGREQLIRFMQAEQGFAMRPLPIGNLDLEANGPMSPGGEKYIDELHQKGVSVKPGDRVVVTDIKFHENSISIDLNNGPEHKHKYLRHVSIGMDPTVSNPIVPDDGRPPTGSRITLVFPHRVPDLTGPQMEALLKPMIDFGVKSPAEAYAESLPGFLRKAIMEHRVLIGMNRDMVIYSRGQPQQKTRESENGKPFEVWIYGESPQPVEFVRFVDNYVIRVEDARVGEPMQVRTAYEMGDYFGNQPAVAANQHEVQMGDRTAADVSEENAPKAPPTLRNPGEKLPTDNDKDHSTMAPVKMPPDLQRPGDPGYTPTVSAQPQPATGGTQPASTTSSAPASTSAQQPANTSNSAPQQFTSSVP